MRAYWPVTPAPGNIGDILTPWMMRRDGVEPERVNPDATSKLLGIGSIARFAKTGDNVWTSGIMRRGEGGSRKATYHAVRGPLTAEALGLDPSKVPMGDGALCLPRYYDPPRPDVYLFDLGVVPHYADLIHGHRTHYLEWPDAWKDSARIISPLTLDVEGFIDAICACARIESSSLHGCIIAEAYGVPWKWVRLGDRLNGDDSKFFDAFAGFKQANVDDLMACRPWRVESQERR